MGDIGDVGGDTSTDFGLGDDFGPESDIGRGIAAQESLGQISTRDSGFGAADQGPSGSGGGGGGTLGTPTPDAGPDPFTGIEAGALRISDLLSNVDLGRIDLSQQGDVLSNITNQLLQIGSGGLDPRFQAVGASRLAALRDTQGQQQRAQSEFFSRRGLAGSAAALNQQNRLGSQFTQQTQGLVSELGLQSLGRQDRSLLQAAGLTGQQANLLERQAGFNRAGLTGELEAAVSGFEASTIPQQLRIAQTAAENAGEIDSSGGGGGGLFGNK